MTETLTEQSVYDQNGGCRFSPSAPDCQQLDRLMLRHLARAHPDPYCSEDGCFAVVSGTNEREFGNQAKSLSEQFLPRVTRTAKAQQGDPALAALQKYRSTLSKLPELRSKLKTTRYEPYLGEDPLALAHTDIIRLEQEMAALREQVASFPPSEGMEPSSGKQELSEDLLRESRVAQQALQQQNQVLEERLEDGQQRISVLEQENQLLNDRLNDREEQISVLQQENQLLTDRIEDLQRQAELVLQAVDPQAVEQLGTALDEKLAECTAELDRYQNLADTNQDIISNLTEEYTAIQKEKSTLFTARNDCLRRERQCEVERQRLEQEKAEFLSLQESLEQRASSADALLAELEEERTKHDALVEELTQRFDDARADYATHIERLQKRQQELTRENERFLQSLADITDVTAREKLEEGLLQSQQQVEQCLEDVQDLQGELKLEQLKYAALEKSMAETSSSAQQVQTVLNQLQQCEETLAAQRQEMETLQARMEEREVELARQIQTLQDTLQEREAQLAEQQQGIQTTRAEKDQLITTYRTQIATLEREQQELEQRFAELENNLQTAASEHAQQVQTLQQQVQECTTDLSARQRELQTTQQLKEQLESSVVTAYATQVQTLQQEQRELQQRNALLQHNLRQANSALSEQAEEVRALEEQLRQGVEAGLKLGEMLDKRRKEAEEERELLVSGWQFERQTSENDLSQLRRLCPLVRLDTTGLSATDAAENQRNWELLCQKAGRIES